MPLTLPPIQKPQQDNNPPAQNNTPVPQNNPAPQRSLPPVVKPGQPSYSYRPSVSSVPQTQTPYQANVAQYRMPQQPTTRDIYAGLYQLAQLDPQKASELSSQFAQQIIDPTSQYYNPYQTHTNRSVDNLAAMGIDTSNINDDWFQQTAWLADYLVFNGTTNTPSSPGKKASAEQKAAYEWYQIGKEHETTKKAKGEWAALQEELAYWATNDKMNLSDDQIIERIYGKDGENFKKKYPTLASMDDSIKDPYGTPIELNSVIGYSKDNVYGVLWAARNGGGTGNTMADMIMSATGQGNQWVENPEISAKLNVNDSNTFSPYSVGMTLEEEGLYFGVPEFTPEVIAELEANPHWEDETWAKNMRSVQSAFGFTTQANYERDVFQRKLDKELHGVKNPEDAKKIVENLLNKEVYDAASKKTVKFDSLKALDSSIEGRELIPTTSAIDYRKQDMIDYARSVIEKNAGLATGTDVQNNVSELQSEQPTGTKNDEGANDRETTDAVPPTDTNKGTGGQQTSSVPPATETETAIAQSQDAELSDARGALYDDASDMEKAVMDNGWSVLYGNVKNLWDGMAGYGKNFISNLSNQAKDSVMQSHAGDTLASMQSMYDYEKNEEEIQSLQLELDALKHKYGDATALIGLETQGSLERTITVDGVNYQVFLEEGPDGEYFINAADDLSGNDRFGVSDPELFNRIVNSDEGKKEVSSANDRQKAIGSANEALAGMTEGQRAELQAAAEQMRSLELQIEDKKTANAENEAQYKKDSATFEASQRKLDQQIYVMKLLGMDTSDMEQYEDTIAYLADFADYEATVWSAYNPSDAYRIALAEGDDRDAVYAAAKKGNDAILEELENAKAKREYIQEHGLNIPQNYLNNLDRHIAKLERNVQDYEDFLLSKNDDWEEMIAKGRREEYENRPQQWSLFRNPELDWTEEEYYQHLNEDNYDEMSAFSDYGLRGVAGMFAKQMTEDEKNTYYYLMGKGEKERALEYVSSLMDMSYGVLHTRYTNELREQTEGMFREEKSQDFATKEDADKWIAENGEKFKDYNLTQDENGYHISWSQSRGAGAFVGTNILAILASPAAAMASLGYIGYSLISGDEINPDNALLAANTFRSATREQSAKEISDYYGEGTFAQQAVQMFYEIVVNRLDSAANGAIFGGLTGGIGNEMLQEFLGASPMGFSAAMDAMMEAKRKGASDAQAYGIGLVTFICETGTEAVSLDNMKNAFKLGKEVTADGIRGWLVNWLTSSGVSEMVGETANEYFENLSDEAIMGALSDHSDRVWFYRMKGYGKEEADAMARRDEVMGLARTALMSYLSPGMDIVSYGVGRADYYRQKTRARQQIGIGGSIINTVQDERNARIEAERAADEALNDPLGSFDLEAVDEEMARREARDREAEIAENGVENGEGRFVMEDADIDPSMLQSKTNPAPETTSATGETQEEETPSVNNPEHIASEYNALQSVKGNDSASQSGTVASVLDTAKTEESGDMANAAAMRLGEMLGEDGNPADFMQNMLLGADAEGVDVGQVKQAIQNAALGGENSAAWQLMQTDEFKNADYGDQAAMLAGTVEADSRNQALMQEIGKNVHDYRVVEAEKDLLKNGFLDKLKTAKTKVEETMNNLRMAQESLQEKHDERQAKSDALQAASEEFNNNPTNDNQHAVDRALNELNKADIVAQEYEQHLAAVERANTEAQENAKRTQETAVRELRQQAEAAVAEQDQQRAERAAQRAKQERIAAEQKAQAQAEEDQRSGKAQEDADLAAINAQIERLGLRGRKAEKVRQQLQQFYKDMSDGKIDTSKMLTDSEAYLALGAMSRRLGVQIEIGKLPDGKDGVYNRESGKIVLSDRLTVGQALIEVGLHEITHSLEGTKSYDKYKKTVLGILYSTPEQLHAAVQERIDRYGRQGVKLTEGEAEAELVADFAKDTKRFANRDTISRMMDAGLGGKMRNTLHNINQFLKNMKLTGQEKVEAENLRRAERLYIKAINDRRSVNTHPSSEQFSVNQFAQAAGLFYNEVDITGENGKVLFGSGLYTADPATDKNAKKIEQVTPEMMENTPVGRLTNAALALGTMNRETVGKVHKMFADLMTMCSNLQDTNLVWEIAGSTLYSEFSAIKSNSDKQYSTTVDFGTICTKTQAVIEQLSRDMLRLGRGLSSQEILQVYNDVYNADLKVPCPVCYVFSRWLGVPSLLENIRQYQNRFLGEEGAEIPREKTEQLVDDFIKKAHKDYGIDNKFEENVGKAREKALKKQRSVNRKIATEQAKIADYDDKLAGNPTRGDWLRNRESAVKRLEKLQGDLEKAKTDFDNADVAAYTKAINKKKADIEESIKKKQIKIEGDDRGTRGINDDIQDAQKEGKPTEALEAKREKLYGEIDGLYKKLREVDAYNWVTQALCKVDDKGKFVVDWDGFARTKNEILLDLRRTGEFAKDTKNWTYRSTRGAGMGKAILPYSGASLGDSVLGTGSRVMANPYNDTDNEEGAIGALKSAIAKAKRQNLIGGQRFQSTSDFRPEWGLDYIMTFVEQQAIGSNGQLYTKVNEAVPLYASVGIDTNCSIMPYANGFHYAEDGEIEKMSEAEKRSRVVTFSDGEGHDQTVVLDFSDVTGMDYNAARLFSKSYDNVQMIMVGINDIHIRACLGSEEIDFVIPWHASGNTKSQLASMMKTVDETLTNSSDYTMDQTDYVFDKEGLKEAHGKIERGEDLTDHEEDLIHKEEMRDARERLLTGKTLTETDLQRIGESKYLTSLYERFMGKTLDGQELEHDPNYWISDNERVTMTSGQAEQLFPYEYWDTTLKKDKADQNGLRFIEYCNELGLVPRFSGANQKNDDGSVSKFGNFSGAVYDKNGNITGYDPAKMAKGYWKLLIDRKMYDNNGNYRAQQQIDASKVNAGSLMQDENGNRIHVGSNIPDQTAGATYRGEEAEAKYQKADRTFRARIEEKAAKGDKQAILDLERMNAYDNAKANTHMQYDLSGEINAETDLTQGQMMQMLRDADVDYQDAVARGDTEEAQRMVAAAAASAGYTIKVYHGTANGGHFTVFDPAKLNNAKLSSYIGQGFYFTNSESGAREYTQNSDLNGRMTAGRDSHLFKGYIKLQNPIEITEDSNNISYDVVRSIIAEGNKSWFFDNGIAHDLQGILINGRKYTKDEISAMSKDEKIDLYTQHLIENGDRYALQHMVDAYSYGKQGLLLESMKKHTGKDGIHWQMENGIDQYVIFDSSQFKESDPVTYDNNGNVIPLSERFNQQNEDIRYSMPDDTGSEDMTEGEMLQLLQNAGIQTSQNSNVPGQPTTLPGMPNEGGSAQRQFGSKTAQESDALHDDVKNYLYNHSSYTPDTNSAQIDRAISWVQSNASQSDPDGFFSSLQKAHNGDFDSISADGQARMLTLMGMAALKGEETGDHSSELMLADLFNKQGTEAGRALQARKMFRLMTPVGRMATLNKMADQINEEYGKKGNERRVHLSDWTLQAAAVAESEEDFQKVQKAAAAELASQMPANWKEKFTAIRMLSMLGNVRTHDRNLVGNLAFMPAVGLKNKIGAGLEAAFVKKGDRTKTIGLATPESRAFAKQYAKQIEGLLRGESKYNEGGAVQRERKMFGQGNGILSKTLGQATQWLIDVNGNALEAEDWIFLNRHFRNAFAGYMTANGLTEADMKGDTLDKATAYAVGEAQKATYRDANEIADWMNKVKNPAAKFVINAVLPFKKTPMNILKRGVEYSPVSIIRSLTSDAKHLKQWQAYQNGELSVLPEKAISPSQYIDRLSAGLSGTLIVGLGALLSSLGFVRGGMDDDDDEFDKLNGSQEYSLEIGGVSFTIDWAAPICMPLFVGATVMEEAKKAASGRGEGVSIGSVLDSILGIAEPVTQLSMLDGLNSVLNPSNYGDTDSLIQVGEKVITNYATSYVPTFLGQVARTIDTTRRRNFVESGADLKVFRSALEQVENKIPFLSQKNIPYRNVWGEADVSPQGWAAIENFLSPGYGNTLKDDPVTNELKRIYQETGNPNMIPKAAGKTVTINGKNTPLNAEQYDQYVVDRGQTAYNCIKDLMESPVWQICDDDTRALMITDAWNYANQIGRHNVDNRIKKDSWVANAEHNGNFVDTVIDRAAESNRSDYIKGYGQTMAEALDNKDSEMYQLSFAAMENADATEAEIRGPLRDYFKPLYQQAFEANDQDAMDEIMEKLLDADVGFKEKDIRAWAPSEVEQDEEKPDNSRWLNMDNYNR